MTAPNATDDCIDPQTLAAFAEGALTRQEMQPVLAHLERCPRCMHALEHTSRLIEETGDVRERSSRGTWWLVLAATLVIAVVGLIAIRSSDPTGDSRMARLVALTEGSPRSVEPRLSGAFAWGPYDGPMRSGDAANDTRRMKLSGVAGELVDEAERESSTDAQHAAGVALVLIERPLDAVTRLRAAAERSPTNAKLWSDLSAAEYAAALQLVRPSLYPEALASADRALSIDPRLPEALFNRALVLERLGLPLVAREAWERYLAVDPSSRWAEEARNRLARLRSTTSELQFRNELPQLEAAALRGDREIVKQLVARYPQQSRAFAEAEHLGRWGAALQSNDTNAASQLTIARSVGAALAATSGEQLLADTVRVIDAADPQQRRAIAAAHVLYRQGRLAYSRQEPAVAERDLRNASAQFASAGSPMARVAAYYAASTRYDQNDIAAARIELEQLLANADLRPDFIALGAQLRWQLALCSMVNDDWATALPLLQNGHAAFRRLNESSNIAVMEAMIADALTFLGRPDEAWAARIRSLEMLSGEGRGDRLPVAIGEAALMELRVGKLAPARALLSIEEAIVRDHHVLHANTLARRAMLHALMRDDRAASADAAEAFVAARRIGDAALRARALADAELAAGAAALESDPRKAHGLLTAAIQHDRETARSFYLPDAFLLRARANVKNGDPASAMRDLESGIAEVEKHRSKLAGGVVGYGVLDAGNALYQDAIRLRLDERDIDGAFAYAERWRFRLAPGASEIVSIAGLRQRLAHSGAAVMELVMLPGELVAFCITSDDATVKRRSISNERLAALVARKQDAELYDLLIRPGERALSRVRQLVVVADPALADVSFAALYDNVRKQHLVERFPIALAPSASALRSVVRETAPRVILAVALPSGETSGSAGLPASVVELRDVVSGYAEHSSLTNATFASLIDASPRADVIHIAGHTERQPGPGEAALLFRGEAISWRGIASHPLARASIVVLAACETLRAPGSAHARALSLGGAFLAAGAEDVIGTLAPVPDEQARVIFTSIHLQLSRGIDAATALRSAQLEAIASRRGAAWRDVAVLTTRIQQEQERSDG
ncbi:MAG TPA: tetratricopeptide repeat protein [Thermoanaerobaculia bacterium]|jgi:hypothetical protein|nr:tetratricopeptide repeat protein [Thermoanaerobaculia bacterium]